MTPQKIAELIELTVTPHGSKTRFGVYMDAESWGVVMKSLRASPSEAEGPPADLVARCREVLNWKRSGVLRGDALRRLAASEWRHRDERNELRLAETQTADEAMEMIVLLSRSKEK